MPKVRRESVPSGVLRHLLRRAREREVTRGALNALQEWLNADPTVPVGKWFKTFEGFHVCGEGELVLTFLVPGQAPEGEEVR